MVFGNSVTESGFFAATFDSNSNCDSTHQVEVIFQSVTYGEYTDTYCAGKQIEINGIEISTNQNISLIETGFNGCDSIHTLSIQFIVENPIVDSMHLCFDDFTLFIGDTIRASGIYNTLLPASAVNCDTIYELVITVSETLDWSLPDTIFAINGTTIPLPLQLDDNGLLIS